MWLPRDIPAKRTIEAFEEGNRIHHVVHHFETHAKNQAHAHTRSIAIMIGTAFIASTFLFGNAMNDSLTRQLTAMFGNANYAVSINSSDLSDKELNEAYSSTVGDFHLDQIAGIEGVGGVRASVETGVSVSKGDSTVSGEIISTAAQKNMLPVNITEGDQPKDSNEVALPEDMAKQLNVGVGDTVSLTSRYAVGDDGKAKADNVRVVDSRPIRTAPTHTMVVRS